MQLLQRQHGAARGGAMLYTQDWSTRGAPGRPVFLYKVTLSVLYSLTMNLYFLSHSQSFCTILSHSQYLCLAFFLIIHIFILSHSQSFCTILSHSQYLCFTLSWCCIPSVSHQDLHQVQEPSHPDMGAVGSGPKIDSTWQIISGPV